MLKLKSADQSNRESYLERLNDEYGQKSLPIIIYKQRCANVESMWVLLKPERKSTEIKQQ